MIGFLLPVLARWGVPERVRKPLATAALIVAAFAFLAALWGIWLWQHDKGVIEAHEAEREARAGEARETAADERVKDAIRDTANEKDLHDAIDTAPTGGELSPAARALACERLRKLGRIPPACRSGGGDGSQARPD
jgi:hypothetical protein